MLKHHDREKIIWESKLSTNEVVLLLALNTFVDSNGECWPGQEILSRMTKLSDRTIRNLCTELEQKKIITRSHRQRKDGSRTSDKYRVNFDAIANFLPEPVSGRKAQPEPVSGRKRGKGVKRNQDKPSAQPETDSGRKIQPENDDQSNRKITTNPTGKSRPIQPEAVSGDLSSKNYPVELSSKNKNPPLPTQRVEWWCGEIPSELISFFDSCCNFDAAIAFHDHVEHGLLGLGYKVEREFEIADRGDGRVGRIDLVASKNDCRIGIELDNQSARSKSITKLESLVDATGCLIALRNIQEGGEVKQYALAIDLPQEAIASSSAEQQKPDKQQSTSQKEKCPPLSSERIKKLADNYNRIIESQKLGAVWHQWQSQVTSDSRKSLLKRFWKQCFDKGLDPFEVWQTGLLYGIENAKWVKNPRSAKHCPDTFMRTTSDWVLSWYSAAIASGWEQKSPAQKLAESYSKIPKALQAIYARELQELQARGVTFSGNN